MGDLATYPLIAGLYMVEVSESTAPAIKDHSGKMSFSSLLCASFLTHVLLVYENELWVEA